MTDRFHPSPEAQRFAAEVRKSGVKQMMSSVEAARAAVQQVRAHPASNDPPQDFVAEFEVGTTAIIDPRGNEWVVHTATPRDREPERTVVFTHGGAFVLGMSAGHWFFCGDLITNTAARVVIPLYPLAPDGTGEFVPDMIADIVARIIADEGAGNVSIMGDSAGGTITLSVAQILRDRGVPNPHLTVLMSPTLDTRFAEPELDELDKVDPFLSPAGCRYAGDLYRGDLPPTDARVSPMLGNNDDLGRVLLLSGTHEILNCQAREYANMAPAFIGTDLEYYEAPQMIHVWVLTPSPEARAAREQIYLRLTRSRDL
ncbi:alpha/beta hydrolase fold domain-containing protein [Nocardia sp. NPDC051570]|uniref:alpha/beta hydrolase fold domain-containing protein n=1 Tax=Nocardia sp. NPDC051570 TaxID=3364324 RepID=UPI00378BE691